MDGLTALSGLTGFTIEDNEATPQERSGDPADPRHGSVGEAATPYSWQSLQVPGASALKYGPEDDGLLDTEFFWYIAASQVDELPAGETAPWTHAGPWPSDPIGDGSVSPDNAIRQLQMNAALRSLKVGPASRAIFRPQANPQQDAWQEIWQVDPNSSDLTMVPEQMKSGAAPGGRGHTDRTQSHAKQNSYGFDSRHIHRRFAVGHIPGNFQWLLPSSRPLVKSTPGPARPPIGDNSQFAGQNLGRAFNTDGAILTNPPNEYQPAPVPYVNPNVAQAIEDQYDYTEYFGM